MMTAELAKQLRELIDAGARPVSLSEIRARAHSRRPEMRGLRLGWAAAVVAGAVAAGCVGAVTIGRLTASGHLAAHPASPAAAVLTAAQVRQMTMASRAALAHSARAHITYGGTGLYQAYQSEYVSFSGRNYSLAGSVLNPWAHGRPGQLTWFAERVINGQAYDHEFDSRVWRWYHYTGVAGGQAARVLDPRAILRVLAPGARFRLAGHLVAGGVLLERLQASAPANVPGFGFLPGGAGEYVTALSVLVDSHGVVHQVNISLRGTTLTAAARAHEPASGTGPPAGQRPVPLAAADSTAMTVTFAGIGQPQTITVPPHVISVRAPWGANGHPLPS